MSCYLLFLYLTLYCLNEEVIEPSRQYRERPKLKIAASSVEPKSLKDEWELGNVHNFDEFVCTAALFCDNLTAELRTLFSPGFAMITGALSVLHTQALSIAKISIKRHKSMLHPGGDKFGVFRFREDIPASGNQDEQRLSLSITSGYEEYIACVLSALNKSHVIFGAREQYDNSKNSQDFVINRVFPDGTLQAVVTEFANDIGKKNDHKEAQLMVYIQNDIHSLPSDRSILTLGVSFVHLKTNTPSFQVFGYYQNEGTVFDVVPLAYSRVRNDGKQSCKSILRYSRFCFKPGYR